jgi:hypothetical protein
MRLLALFAGVCAVAFLLVTFGRAKSGVEAGTAIRMDVGELCLRSELVIEARILGMLALQEPDGRIETELQLEVQRTFVGDDVVYRAVRLPGGRLPDGRGMMLAGMPSIEVGETAILFLTAPTASGMRMPVGLAQGKMRVVVSPAGEKLVVADRGCLGIANSSTDAVAEAVDSLVLPYAQVLAQIEAACAGALDNDDGSVAPLQDGAAPEPDEASEQGEEKR